MRSHRLVIVVLTSIGCFRAGAQSIVTIAGGGTDDGRAATRASLYYGRGVAVDTLGNLYVSATFGSRVRRVDASTGVLTTIAGNGTYGYAGDEGAATRAFLGYPTAVAVDAAGNVYVSDNGYCAIRRVEAATGLISTVAGGSGCGFSGDGGPATLARTSSVFGLAFDPSGDLYLSDYSNRRIRRVARDTGLISTVAGTGASAFLGDGGPATAAGLTRVMGISFGPDGSLYVADLDNGRIRRIARNGIISTIAGGQPPGPRGDGGPATLASLPIPTAVAAAGDGSLFIAHEQYVRRVSPAGIITTVAGNGSAGSSGDGGPATAAALTPFALAVGPRGDVFIMDDAEARLRRLDRATGILTTVAGSADAGFVGDGGPARDAGLYFPYDLDRDGDGNLYIADHSNARIRRVDSRTGRVSTLAGTGRFGHTGDGGPGTAAELGAPTALRVDGAGALIFTQEGPGLVRRLDLSTGLLSTLAGRPDAAYLPGDEGGPATAAAFAQPFDLLVEPFALLVTDLANDRIRRIDRVTGRITSVVGVPNAVRDGAPASQTVLVSPVAGALDPSGNLVVSGGDCGAGATAVPVGRSSNSLARVAADGSAVRWLTLLSPGAEGCSGVGDWTSRDGRLASTIPMARPRGVAVDAAATSSSPRRAPEDSRAPAGWGASTPSRA